MFYVKDKQLIAESFGASALKFHFYENKYSGQNDVVDYKDWIVGLARRNNGLKIFYFFQHYGVEKIKLAVEGQEPKFEYFLELLKSRPDLFQLHTRQFGVFTFFVLDKKGEASH